MALRHLSLFGLIRNGAGYSGGPIRPGTRRCVFFGRTAAAIGPVSSARSLRRSNKKAPHRKLPISNVRCDAGTLTLARRNAKGVSQCGSLDVRRPLRAPRGHQPQLCLRMRRSCEMSGTRLGPSPLLSGRRDYRDLIPAGGGGPGVIDSITGVATGRGPLRDTL